MKQAVILAGGEGLRLKKVSGDLPKPMVPVKGKYYYNIQLSNASNTV